MTLCMCAHISTHTYLLPPPHTTWWSLPLGLCSCTLKAICEEGKGPWLGGWCMCSAVFKAWNLHYRSAPGFGMWSHHKPTQRVRKYPPPPNHLLSPQDINLREEFLETDPGTGPLLPFHDTFPVAHSAPIFVSCCAHTCIPAYLLL